MDLLLALVDQTFGGTNWNYLLHKQELVTDAKIYAWNSYK